MSMSSNATGRQPWEELDDGLEENTVAATDLQTSEIDDALGLQMISIRLQRTLIKNMKLIADYHGVGYQPLIRDLLNRFAKSELGNIVREIEAKQAEFSKLEAATKESAPMKPIDNFLAREGEGYRKRA